MTRLTSSPTTVTVARIPAWRQSIKPQTWARVGNSLAAVNPADDPSVNPGYAEGTSPWAIIPNADGTTTGATEGFSAIVEDWSGGAFNTATNQLWIHGGGHNGYAGNELLSIDLSADSPAWRLERSPTGAIGNTGVLADSKEATFQYFDGRPRSSHTYNNMVWVGAELYHVPAAVFMQPTRENAAAHRLFKHAADWTRVMTFPSTTIGITYYGAMCYDSKRQQLVYSSSMNRPLQMFKPDGSGFSFSSQSNGADGDQRLVYIPELDIVVVLNAIFPGKFAVFDFGRTSTAGNIPVPPVSGSAPATLRQTGEWIPSLGAIALWNGGTGLDLLKPPPSGNPATGTWTWSRLEAASGNTVQPDPPTANGVFGRFFFSPTLNCVGVVNAIDKPMCVFALG